MKNLYIFLKSNRYSVLDLGANQGYFRPIFAQLVGTNGSVHCLSQFQKQGF